MRIRQFPTIVTLLCVAAIASCGGTDTHGYPPQPPPAPVVALVDVSPTAFTLEVGTTTQLGATPRDAFGRAISGRSITWNTPDPAIATVSGTGLVTAVASGGPVAISATIDARVGTSQATIVPVPVATITLTPSTATVPLSGAVQLTVTLQDAQGATLSGRVVNWSTTNASVATVTSSGMVTGVAEGGPVSIVATSEGRSAAAQVTVIASPPPVAVATVTVTPATLSLSVGSSIQLTATLRDAGNNVLTGRPLAWSSANNSVATVSSAGLVIAVSAGGPVAITAVAEGQQGSASVTATPAVSVPATITLNGSLQYQTMTGWEALAEIGQAECDPRAYQSYKSGVLDRAANELGINRIRIALRNGYENPVDQFIPFHAGQLTFNQWKVFWFQVVNDNNDPFVMNPAGFNWGYLDYTIDELVVPLKQRLATRGEGFWLNLVYTGANSGDLHRDNPEEYAELVLAAFQHLNQKYGWVPNSLELINEPNLGTWNGTQAGQALVAAKRRLNQAGFFPQFVGPSVSQVTPSLPFFDQMMQVPGAPQALNEFSYHRYNSKPTDNQLRAIAQRATTYGIRTAMLEHGGSGYEDLYEDLTLANVSSWEQFGLSFCGDRDIGGNYFPIYGASLGHNTPSVRTGEMTKYLRQYFRYVALGAVRVGATSAEAQWEPVAFRNPDGRYVVVVKAAAGGTFTVALPAGTYGIDYTTATAYMQALPDVTVSSNGTLSATIPATGVITIFPR
ncbi:MAG: Ig-like domain-containing protein [Gemmatimonadota bacterium]